MAAIVSTRILRLQAISPRVSPSLLPSSISAVTLGSTAGSAGTPDGALITLKWDAASGTFQIWKDNAFHFSPSGTLIFSVFRALFLDAAVPGVSVATSAPSVVGPYTAAPPTLALDSAVPGVSVSAHSP